MTATPDAEHKTAVSLRHSGTILLTLASAQLMVVLDNSVVNIALPAAQEDLSFPAQDGRWVVISYALAFGSLLLIGGRLADVFGRRQTFLAGLAGFAAASALGGAAVNFEMLVASRTLQGVFGALLTPSALSLMTTAFPSGKARARAFGMFAAIIGSGAAVGLVLGGVLTEYVGWRSTLYINVLIALPAFVGAIVLLPRERPEHTERVRIDHLGAALVVLGMAALVYGLAGLEDLSHGVPTQPLIWTLAGVALTTAFVVWQRYARSPLLPLRILADRDRIGAYVTRFTASAGNFAGVFFVSMLVQHVGAYSPVQTGLAILPMIAGITLSSNGFAGLLLPRLGNRVMTVVGLLLSGAGLWWLSFYQPDHPYLLALAAPLLVFGLGQGIAGMVATSVATYNLPAHDVGVASAFLNVTQQLGGSLGTTVLSTISGITAASYLAAGHGNTTSALHGYTSAFLAGGLFFVFAAVLGGALMRSRRAQRMTDADQ